MGITYFAVTESKGQYLIACECDVLPWEECKHSDMQQERVFDDLFGGHRPGKGTEHTDA